MQCIIEIPSYLGMQFLRTYADDPDVKFILTERDPGRWARSFLNTVGYVVDLASSFPVNILKRFEGHVGAFLYLNQIAFGAFADGASPGDAAYAEMALRRNYLE